MKKRTGPTVAIQNLLIAVTCGAFATAQTSTADDYRILSETGTATIPFKMLGDDIVLAVEINGQELHLGLDNGSVWDQLFLYGSPRIDALDLEYDGMKVQVAGAGTGPMATADMASGFTIKLPGVELRNQSAIIASAASGLADLFEGEDGAISGSLFNHFIVRIDFDKMAIVLAEPERFKAPASAEALTMTPIGMGAYTLPCTVQVVGGKPIAMNPGIDLGSINPLLLFEGTDKDFAVPGKVIKTSLGAGVQGDVIGHVGRIKSLRLGRYTLTDVITGFTRMEVWPGNGDDGLVGMPVFSRFHLTFDYGNERLYLEPNRRFKNAFEFDMSGLRLKSSEDGSPVIARIIPGSPASEVDLKIGDVVLQIDGTAAGNLERWDITRLFRRTGETVTLKIVRSDEEREVKLKLRRLI